MNRAACSGPIGSTRAAAWSHGALFAALLLSLAAEANADTAEAGREQARKRAYAGVAALQAGDVATARKNLDEAYAVLRVPSIALWSARALVADGDLLQARQRLRDTTLSPIFDGDPEIQKNALQEARTELAALEQRIPSVSLRAEATDSLRVEIDGRPLQASQFDRYAVNPGKHRLDVHSDQAHYQVELTLSEGEHQIADLPLRRAATQRPPLLASDEARSPEPCAGPDCERNDPRRIAGWVALGAGAAAFVGAGVAGYIAGEKLDRIHNDPRCSRDVCNRDAEELVDAYGTARTLSTVGWIAGGALTLTGAGLLLFSVESPSGPVAVSAGPLHVDLRARF